MIHLLMIIFSSFNIYSYDYQIEEIKNDEIIQDRLYLDEEYINQYDLKEDDKIRIYFNENDDDIIFIEKRD
jgi:hypothetical protein